VKGGLVEEERILQERIAAIRARLSGEDIGEADRAGLRKALSEAEVAYSVFLSKVRKQDKEQATLMSVEPLGLKQVQELLDPDTSLLEYFVTGKEVFAWVVEKEKLQFRRIELPKEKLSGLVKMLRESIFTLGERDKFDEASVVLYKQLIEPLLSHITGKELIIVPHDVLHYLPFHALMGLDGHYLIEKYPIYYLSSASLLQFVQEKRKAGGEKVLAFGNPDLGDPEKNLEYAELEAEGVKNVYPESAVYVKKEASEEKSKSLSPSYDVLHFATHAQLNEDDPLSSAVLLAKEGKEDGRLEVREIFGMDLKANLVVLSGCDTALGKLSTGDELVGLTRAFIYAGTPSVVASLWSVDDSSTAQLMASFYRNLKTMSKAEALRQAQLELIRGEGRSDLIAKRGVGGIGKLGETPEGQSPSEDPISVSTSHPYFWAPFILVGDGK
jgi:CHAT domain-containing protein